MSDLASVLRRVSAAVAGTVLIAGASAAVAQGSSYGEIGHFGSKGTGVGQLEPNSENAAIGVDPEEENSVFVVDQPNPEKENEFRIQKFAATGGVYKAVASTTFKPHDPEAEEPDIVEGVAVDPKLKRIYVLAAELRPEKEGKIDPGVTAASQLYAFSTEQSGEKLVPAEGTPKEGTEAGVLAGSKVFKPASNKFGEALLEPAGIAVDPQNHDVIIAGAEDNGTTEEPLIAVEQVSDTGAIGERWVDVSNYFEDEASSPAVSQTGHVYLEYSTAASREIGEEEVQQNEIAEIPLSKADAVPVPFIQSRLGLGKQVLTTFPGSPAPESGGAVSIGEEGTIYTRADVVEQAGGLKTGYRYPGVIAFSAAGEEEGWTGGQSVASDGEHGLCQIISTESQVAAGKGHDVFVYDSNHKEPRIIEFGPGGGGCPTATATVPAATVNGVPVGESVSIPIAEEVTLSSELTEANALKVQWKFGDGKETKQETEQYQTTEVTHKFAEGGELEITERIETDDLADPVIEKHRKIKIRAAGPTAATGEVAQPVERTSATLKGTVDPNGEKVTACKFEYATAKNYEKTKTYENSATCSQALSSLGEGASPVAVSAQITGLTEHTPYHFRLVATSAGGASDGVDRTFTTGLTPAVVTGAATSVAQTSATLNATVSPEGAQVSECYFQYGTSESYGLSVPCSSLPGAGTSPVAVSAALPGLAAGTSYDFRIVATNVSGTSYGKNEAFTTAAVVRTGGQEPVTPPAQEVKTATTGVLNEHTAKPPAPEVKLVGSSASVSKSGAFTLKVTCPTGDSSCSGTVTLKTLKAVVASIGHQAKSKAAILTLATVSFTLAGGQVKTITLHLSSKARTLLAHTHVVSARATIVAHDPAGESHTTTVTVTLRPAKAAKHH